MSECYDNYCQIPINNYVLMNNKWGNPNATQSIFNTGSAVGFQWNNGGGYNFPEIIAGSDRNCSDNTWSSFPIQYNALNSCSVEITWKFTQKPPVNTWWMLGFDIYWMDNTTNCDYGKQYNVMIWIHGQQDLIGDPYIKDVNDGFNTWSYYQGNRDWPWDCFILKNREQIPYEPVLNQEYTIKINIKALMNAVTRTLNGGWYIPGLEFGTENSGDWGTTSGRIEISRYDIEVNGNTTGLGFTTPTKYKCSGSPYYECTEDPNGSYNSLSECQTACTAPPETKYKCSGSPDYQCTADPNGPYNSLTECQAACVNLLTNSGFEECLLEGWTTYTTGTTHKYRYPEIGRTTDGIAVAIEYLTRESGKQAQIIQTVPIDNTKNYKLSGYMKTMNMTGVGTGSSFQVVWKDNSDNVKGTSTIMTYQNSNISWTNFQGDVTPAASSTKATVMLLLNDCQGKVLFDDMSFIQTTTEIPTDLLFEDNFDGSSLDTTKWTTKNNWQHSASPNTCMDSNNVYVNSGSLIIRSKNDGNNVCGYTYSSGYLDTKNKFSFTFGYAEMRAKLPKGQGIWPAFWMLPSPSGWPPEIDIFEMLGHQPTKLYFNVHAEGCNDPNCGGYSCCNSGSYIGSDYSADYHTFAIEWTSSIIKWYVDGVERFSSTQYVPQGPMFLVIDTFVGGDWPGQPDSSTVFPQYYYIDYIRVYGSKPT